MKACGDAYYVARQQLDMVSHALSYDTLTKLVCITVFRLWYVIPDQFVPIGPVYVG